MTDVENIVPWIDHYSLTKFNFQKINKIFQWAYFYAESTAKGDK